MTAGICAATSSLSFISISLSDCSDGFMITSSIWKAMLRSDCVSAVSLRYFHIRDVCCSRSADSLSTFGPIEATASLIAFCDAALCLL